MFLKKIWQKKLLLTQKIISTAIVDDIAEVQQKTIIFLKTPNLHEGPYPVADLDFLHRGSHARI
jgi:hypothetical protein